MIQVCHIVPVSYQDYLDARGLGRFLMAMAPMVHQSSQYARWFKSAKERGAHVVLDNGTPYLGQSVPDDELVAAAELLRPDVVILPDVLYDGEATGDRIDSFLSRYCRSLCTSFMGVVQGTCVTDYVEAYCRVACDSQILHVGLPFMNVGHQPDGLVFEREGLVAELVNKKLIRPSKPHHLLGLSHSGHIELQRLNKYPFITSCDTSAAYKSAALTRRVYPEVAYAKPEVPMDFSADFDLDTAELTVTNATCIDYCARKRSESSLPAYRPRLAGDAAAE